MSGAVLWKGAVHTDWTIPSPKAKPCTCGVTIQHSVIIISVHNCLAKKNSILAEKQPISPPSMTFHCGGSGSNRQRCKEHPGGKQPSHTRSTTCPADGTAVVKGRWALQKQCWQLRQVYLGGGARTFKKNSLVHRVHLQTQQKLHAKKQTLLVSSDETAFLGLLWCFTWCSTRLWCCSLAFLWPSYGSPHLWCHSGGAWLQKYNKHMLQKHLPLVVKSSSTLLLKKFTS